MEKPRGICDRKDSPNTEEMLNRPLDRKRKTIQGHIRKAVNQMRGALTYARDNQGVTILSNNKPISIPLESRQITVSSDYRLQMHVIDFQPVYGNSHEVPPKLLTKIEFTLIHTHPGLAYALSFRRR